MMSIRLLWGPRSTTEAATYQETTPSRRRYTQPTCQRRFARRLPLHI